MFIHLAFLVCRVCVSGICGSRITLTPIEGLQEHTDFKHRVPKCVRYLTDPGVYVLRSHVFYAFFSSFHSLPCLFWRDCALGRYRSFCLTQKMLHISNETRSVSLTIVCREQWHSTLVPLIRVLEKNSSDLWGAACPLKPSSTIISDSEL